MKTRFAMLVILIAACSVADAGDGDHHFKRVYIGFSFTPEVSYNYLVNNYVQPGSSSSANTDLIMTERKQISPDFGASATFKLGINLTHWLAIETGVGYMLAQYRYSASQPLSFAPLSNTIAASDTINVKEKETYQYMTVPIGLRFSLGHRRVRGVIAAGVDLDFLLKQSENYTYTTAIGETTTTNTYYQTKNFNTFNVSPYFGLGIDCYLSHTTVLRLMPVAQIQTLKNINEPVSEYLWNVGFNIAFLFGL